jgi:undecaprenyl-diphosphatase
LNDVFVWLSAIGTVGAVWAALAVVLAVWWRRPAILWTLPVVWGADLAAAGLKLAVGRARPHYEPLVQLPHDLSFPSGHAATSFAGATMLAAFAPRLAPALYVLAAAIAFSRVYVGVHWPLDVLGGAALGAALALVALTSLRRLGRSLRRSRAAPRPG